MPTYLCHGFRWHRKSIRYFIAKHDIEDGATEWIIAPQSEAALVEHFYSLYSFLTPVASAASAITPSAYPRHNHAPSKESCNSYTSRSDYHASATPTHSSVNIATARSRSISRPGSNSLNLPGTNGHEVATPSIPSLPLPLLSASSVAKQKSDHLDKLPAIRLLEEFDPTDESAASGPWAYVTDHVVRVDTSVSIADEMFRYEKREKRNPNRAMHGPSDEYGRKVFGASSKKAGWLEKLRDQLQRGESIRWYVVVCGDEDRDSQGDDDEEEELQDEDEEAYEEEACDEEVCEGSSGRSRWLRQSQSTQSTEVTTTTNTSVVEGGFEYRIPELAGLAVRMPTVTPKRKMSKPPLPSPRSDVAVTPSPAPPKSSPPLEPVSNKLARESPVQPRSARSSIGLRRLFSRRKSEESD